MATEDLLGREKRIYLNTGTRLSPVWAEAKRAKDSSFARGKSEADISRKGSDHKLVRGALKEKELNFGYVYTTADDAVMDAIIASYESGDVDEWAYVDGDITADGTKGDRFFGEVMSMPDDDPLEDGSTLDITIKPTSHYVTGVLQAPMKFEIEV